MMRSNQVIPLMFIVSVTVHYLLLPCKADIKNIAATQTTLASYEFTNTTIYKCDDTIRQNYLRINISFGDLITNFRTEKRKLNCDYEEIVPGNTALSVELIESNGMLLVTNKTITEQNRADYFYPQEYCISRVELAEAAAAALSTISFQICRPKCDENHPCIRKCCKNSEVLNATKVFIVTEEYSDFYYVYECSKRDGTNQEYEVTLHHDINTPLSDSERDGLMPHYIVEEPFCRKEDKVVQLSVNESAGETEEHVELLHFKWLKNGSSVHANGDREIMLEDGFCTHLLKEKRWNSRVGVVTCLDPETNDAEESANCLTRKVMGRVNISMHSIAAFFFLLSSIVYILLWNQQNIHGKTVACHVMSSFLMTILFCVVHVIDIYVGKKSTQTFGCFLLGVASHFFSLSSCCWLTMINIDLWWKFRVLQIKTVEDSGRFILYNLFAWGAPFLIVLIGLILDFKYQDYPVNMPKRPRYGQEFCYIARESQWEYVHFFLSALFAINIILFISTVISIYLYKRETFKNLRLGQRSNQDEMFIVFVKLTTVMGFTWGLDIVSKILQEKYELKCDAAALTTVMMLDALNILRAIPIFLIFTCKRKIFAQLWFKHAWLQPFLLCAKIPLCFDALNRERALSHTSAMVASATSVTHTNKIQPQSEKGKATSTEEVAL